MPEAKSIALVVFELLVVIELTPSIRAYARGDSHAAFGACLLGLGGALRRAM